MQVTCSDCGTVATECPGLPAMKTAALAWVVGWFPNWERQASKVPRIGDLLRRSPGEQIAELHGWATFEAGLGERLAADGGSRLVKKVVDWICNEPLSRLADAAA